MRTTMQQVARFTPVYGVGEIARDPLVHSGFGVSAMVNLVAWTVVFGTAAAALFRRDTARV